MELIRVISETLPFMIAGMPNELEDWGIVEAKEAIENNLVASSSRELVEKILPSETKNSRHIVCRNTQSIG